MMDCRCCCAIHLMLLLQIAAPVAVPQVRKGTSLCATDACVTVSLDRRAPARLCTHAGVFQVKTMCQVNKSSLDETVD